MATRAGILIALRLWWYTNTEHFNVILHGSGAHATTLSPGQGTEQSMWIDLMCLKPSKSFIPPKTEGKQPWPDRLERETITWQLQEGAAKAMGRFRWDQSVMSAWHADMKSNKTPQSWEEPGLSRPAEGQGGRGCTQSLTLLWVNSLNMAARPSSSTSLSVLMATLRMWMGSSRALCRDKGMFPSNQGQMNTLSPQDRLPTSSLTALGEITSPGKTLREILEQRASKICNFRSQCPQTSNRSLLWRIQVWGWDRTQGQGLSLQGQ